MKEYESLIHYFNDTLSILIERFKEAALECKNTEDEMKSGIALGYYMTISFQLNQAEVFDVKKHLKPDIVSFKPEQFI
ncbi:MAG: hypothetical protein V2A54_11730 [Bacteroidota bacterium]